MPKTKIALGIEYNGSHYYGWQRQKNQKTIQECLEFALTKIANQCIKTYCAGRTDAGVHATGQVVHIETSTVRTNAAWTIGVNNYLPPDITIRWAKIVTSDFHARFSAIARRYRYIIFNDKYRPAILAKKVAYCYTPLNEKKMHIAAQALIGEKNFSSFRCIECQSKSPFRNITNIQVYRYYNCIIVDITANAFLYRMVRNIVGSLIEIGCGKKDVTWIKELLKLQDRKKAAATAKAEGLYLVYVKYPLKYQLPKKITEPFFIPT
ncbi:tRNA pseudouridine(38-40) synthase TruA [Arsenophonus symbiont of Ornithomya chloropus]|uniref:tRNA pseudouridine(38-40) synthase TruA n=1 Tax=Arsenophonus symbiont of Ornithomya chloropus TaxID=634121 RepID=UPI0032B15D64